MANIRPLRRVRATRSQASSKSCVTGLSPTTSRPASSAATANAIVRIVGRHDRHRVDAVRTQRFLAQHLVDVAVAARRDRSPAPRRAARERAASLEKTPATASPPSVHLGRAAMHAADPRRRDRRRSAPGAAACRIAPAVQSCVPLPFVSCFRLAVSDSGAAADHSG